MVSTTRTQPTYIPTTRPLPNALALCPRCTLLLTLVVHGAGHVGHGDQPAHPALCSCCGCRHGVKLSKLVPAPTLRLFFRVCAPRHANEECMTKVFILQKLKARRRGGGGVLGRVAMRKLTVMLVPFGCVDNNTDHNAGNIISLFVCCFVSFLYLCCSFSVAEAKYVGQ